MTRKLKIEVNEIGRVDDVCPSCGMILDKRPGRKARCPHCRNFIWVRSRPIDRKQVLLKEADLAPLEEQWSLFRGEKIRYYVDPNLLNQQREILERKFRQRPSDRDCIWAALNHESLLRAGQRNWGLYRNVRLSMAAFLEEEGRLNDALAHYLEVCFLDLNGPNNLGGVPLAGYPDFSINSAFLAPAVTAKIGDLSLRLQLNEAGLRKAFDRFAEPFAQSAGLPVSISEAWKRISDLYYE